MDIGIKLKNKANAMVTHRVRITNENQIDKELINWLHEAYNKV